MHSSEILYIYNFFAYSWCRDCIDLSLELLYVRVRDKEDFEEEYREFIAKFLFQPHTVTRYSLGYWMSALQSLVITRRYCFQSVIEYPIFDRYLVVLAPVLFWHLRSGTFLSCSGTFRTKCQNSSVPAKLSANV